MSNRENRDGDRQPWLEARLHRAHGGVVDEPLPADMVEMLRRLDAAAEPDEGSAS